MLARFSLLFILLSCTSNDHYDFNRRNLQDYFIGSGVVRYFLPNLPQWANYSQTGSCKREGNVRYFDMDKLRGNFDLDYQQSIQFQYMFNRELKRVAGKTGILPFKEEETLFYNISDKVQSHFKVFKVPAYKRIHLIWIDRALASKRVAKNLAKLMKSKIMDKGHPVFFSLCLDHDSLVAFIKKFNHPGAKVMPIEMFSVYDIDQKRLSAFTLNSTKIFSADKELHLFVSGRKPYELVGKFKKIHRF